MLGRCSGVSSAFSPRSCGEAVGEAGAAGSGERERSGMTPPSRWCRLLAAAPDTQVALHAAPAA